MPQPTDNPNFYELLCVTRRATPDVIRSSYRRLMQHGGHHPDLGGDTATAALINKAYSVLCHPGKRRAYDEWLDSLAMPAATSGVARTRVHRTRKTVRVPDPARECVFCEQAHDHGTVEDADASCLKCSSPLNAADNLRIEPAGQRAVERISKQLDVTYFTDWRQVGGFAGRTEDVSLHGLRLVTKRPIPKHQRIRVISSMVEAVGEITHCVARRHGWKTEHVAGVSFLTLRFVKSVGGFVSRRV